jgi:outer membrane protein assembly factor BamB
MLWSTEIGGEISTTIAAGEREIYAATSNGERGSLRALDKLTGLTLWVQDYSRPLVAPLVLGSRTIYSGGAEGTFVAIAADNGRLLWKTQIPEPALGRALVTESVVYFGCDDGAMRCLDVENGRQKWSFATTGRIRGGGVLDGEALYFGSADSHVYSLNADTGAIRWRARTGAAVEATPVITDNRLIIGSFDNFVYALSVSNGGRLWKRRLDNRLLATPIMLGDSIVIAPFRSAHLSLLNRADGRAVSAYKLDRGYEIVADPVFSEGLLVVPTDKGVVAATSIARGRRLHPALRPVTSRIKPHSSSMPLVILPVDSFEKASRIALTPPSSTQNGWPGT